MPSQYWTVAYDSGELGSAATSVTISDLDGNTAEEYELICRFVGGNATLSTYQLTFNTDTGNNYGDQYLYGSNTTAAAGRDTSQACNYITISGTDLDDITLATVKIYAKSGYPRTSITKIAEDIVTTTVTTVAELGQVWNNTADNITQMVITATQANGIGVGSRIILLKKTSTASTKTWEEIYTTTLGSAATSVTISSLAGNTDVIYRLNTRVVVNSVAGNVYCRLNNDSTANIYGYQYIEGTNATVTAARGTGNGMYVGGAGAAAENLFSSTLIYAKSGYVRTALVGVNRNAETTTITTMWSLGYSWNNTADEITSIAIVGETNALGIGTYISLERLNL